MSKRPFETHTSTPIKLTPNQRQTEDLAFIQLHGLATTAFIHRFGGYTDQRHTLASLRQLFDGGYLFKPSQQRRDTENANANFFIYALTEKGKQYLKDIDRYENVIPLSGHFAHQIMIACITAQFQVSCREAGYEFIPGHKLQERSGKTLLDIKNGQAIPDQMFGIGYGDTYRWFILEAERAQKDRSTQLRKIGLYRDFIGGGEYRDFFGIEARMFALYVFTRYGTKDNFIADVGDNPWVLGQVAPTFESPWKPPKNLDHLWNEPWSRCGYRPFDVSQVVVE